jgi:hypothetical protein
VFGTPFLLLPKLEADCHFISDNGPQFLAKDFEEFIRILGHDARPNLAVLPTIEREDRALAQIAQRGVHPTGNAVVAQ